MKKPLLLAPAGDYECFLAAIDAGADAVYLAADRFGARAYAGNFTPEEIKKAVRHARLLNRKIHVTLNTLVKESELTDFLECAKMLVDAGVDTFIVQDLGAASVIKENFPEISLHASTQMTVTGPGAARILSDFGFKCIIPARECSIADIKAICNSTEAVVETFIHGAMCYSYSGQCLFSSMLGDRSANRGRCAGPCRMEYDSRYLLSLSDLCAIRFIPELIEAGVGSFKIEGRMKPVEYVSAITSIYRKYIDKYMDDPGGAFEIEKNDADILEGIYHRGKIGAGYLEKERGQQLLTLDSPAYRSGYKGSLPAPEKCRIPVEMDFFMSEDQPLCLTLSSGDVSVTVTGEKAERAKSNPLTEEAVLKQLKKTGESVFSAKEIRISITGEVFCPVRHINEIRREALRRLEEAILSDNRK